MGYGLANSVGKFSSILMPFIMFWLFDYSQELPIISFAICGAISLGISIWLPFDTFQRELDVEMGPLFDDHKMIELAENDSFYTEKYLSMNNNSFEVRYSGLLNDDSIKK
jgi:hypothetical protein